jgi:hypothetical protein
LTTIADNYQKYITSSDPVRAFYENRLYLDAGLTTAKDQLYQAYQDFFCKFGYKWLKAADNRRGGREKKYRWVGVGIRGQQPTTDEGQSTIII